ncbi:MAG: DUF4185 domain-containing protein [Anaerolineae bacterium]|nr:DUF4185 domain-containing protein [Anaerolineae bacterium]
MSITRRLGPILIVCLCLGCARPAPDAWGASATAWPEADALFHRDPHWVGADDAYSVDLGEGRTLWLFADTFIDRAGLGSRLWARMIRNSVAIQDGYDPLSAEMRFHWRQDGQGRPASFFPEQGDDWFWPGHGIRLDDALIIFLMRVRPTPEGLGFSVYDWEVVRIPNPDAPPEAWRLEWLDTPANDLGVIVGSASLLHLGQFVYAFCSREPVMPHPMVLVRWPGESLRSGQLEPMEWWTGGATGWAEVSGEGPQPQPVIADGQTELTVHWDETIGQFLCVQTVGFGAATLAVRRATDLTGPWSAPSTVYVPPEARRPKVLIYAGKAHPQLEGDGLVLTYCTNTFGYWRLLTDRTIYYPRFVRLDRHALER